VGGNPAPCCVRVSYTLPAKAQPAMNPIILIPARMAASRLPGKPLADIEGEPMIVRVLRRAVSAGVGPVAVAAGDREIARAVEAAGGTAVMTDPDLPSGSDRVLAALRAECDISTIAVPAKDAAERANPDMPKAVVAWQADGRTGRALYFTRSQLYGEGPVFIHHGIYGFRRAALERFCAAPPSPLERRERLEQLRALEMGLSIWVAAVDEAPISVDNPADLDRARAYARGLS
jgi:3-deoxy-manno-octulosonate cytidylyltransferase (CMP-KDO synthetase)